MISHFSLHFSWENFHFLTIHLRHPLAALAARPCSWTRTRDTRCTGALAMHSLGTRETSAQRLEVSMGIPQNGWPDGLFHGKSYFFWDDLGVQQNVISGKLQMGLTFILWMVNFILLILTFIFWYSYPVSGWLSHVKPLNTWMMMMIMMTMYKTVAILMLYCYVWVLQGLGEGDGRG